MPRFWYQVIYFCSHQKPLCSFVAAQKDMYIALFSFVITVIQLQYSSVIDDIIITVIAHIFLKHPSKITISFRFQETTNKLFSQ